MIRFAVVFLIIALVAALLGFTGLAADAAWIAKVIALVFLILFLVSMVLGRRGPPAV